MSNNTIHFKGLNGIRALAALSVVFIHISNFHKKRFGLPAFSDNTNQILENIGSYAVTVFFTLSGFLITYLLLQEKKVNSIQIKKFYLRRVLRIWPLYYLYLLIIIFLIFAIHIPVSFIDVVCYIFLFGNIPYITGTSFYVIGHFWSIAVEEQFYLIWPNIIKKLNNYLTGFGITILFLSALKIYLYETNSSTNVLYNILNCVRFDCMILGGILGVMFNTDHKLLRVLSGKFAKTIIWIGFALLYFGMVKLYSPIQQIIISLFACGIINSQINGKDFFINLEKPLLNFLGKISYGIYVIHPVVLFFISKLLKNREMITSLKYAFVYVGGFGITILLAHLSYQYFEKRFLALKSNYAIIKSST